MPYIKGSQRADFLPDSVLVPVNAGNLNYQITTLLMQYIILNGLSYAHINDVLGALEGAKLEFYRRVAVPYENQKIQDNGDVYPEDLTQGGQK